MKTFTAYLVFLLFGLNAYGQFSLSGDLLIRPEFRHGYRHMPSPLDDPGAHVGQRSRLILDFAADRILTKVSLQDIRIWGQEEQRDHNPTYGLHEAWVQLALTDSLFLRAGRQEFRYENQRFFGINDWSLPGQKHDAFLLRYIRRNSELHFAVGFNQHTAHLFGTEYLVDNYQTLNFFYYQTRVNPNLRFSLMGVADGYQDEANSDLLHIRATWIPLLEFRTGDFLFTFNPAYQHGKSRTGVDINAWYLKANVSKNINDQITSLFGVEVFSGNDALEPSPTQRGFDFLYGASHGFLGYMDYFTRMPFDAGGAGILSPHLRNEIRFNPRARLDLDLHVFFLQNNFLNNGAVIDKYLGTELDAKFYYNFNDITQLVFGYSVMFGTESMEIVKGRGCSDEFAHWGFLKIRFRPRFF